MGNFLIVSKQEKLEAYMEIAKAYHTAFELNDFFIPSILDNKEKRNAIMDAYQKVGIPKNSTMHGAFLDIAIFSNDSKIREVSEWRMKQSMEIAKQLGLKGVVFHVNYNEKVPGQSYKQHVVDSTAKYVAKLLQQYPNIEIYLENMFESRPDILKEISKQLQSYPNYGICLDWAHVNAYGKQKETWIEMLHPYVKHLHINDNDQKEDLHLAIGTGKIDWEQFFTYYKKYFQKCSVLIETNEPENQKISLDFIRNRFGVV